MKKLLALLSKSAPRQSPSFSTSNHGTIAVSFALTISALLVGGGLAIDYAVVENARAKVQATLDDATLATAADADAKNLKRGEDFFYKNLNSKLYKTDRPAFKLTGDVITGRVKVNVPLNFMRIFGPDTQTLNLSSSAMRLKKKAITNASFEIISAKGAYDKDIYVFTKDANGKILSEQLVLQYDYEKRFGAGSQKYTPPIGSDSQTVKFQDYDIIGVKLVIHRDKSLAGRKIDTGSISSDDPAAKLYFRLTGDCDTDQTVNVEDGGDADYLDFVFKMKCSEKDVASGEVRLVH